MQTFGYLKNIHLIMFVCLGLYMLPYKKICCCCCHFLIFKLFSGYYSPLKTTKTENSMSERCVLLGCRLKQG